MVEQREPMRVDHEGERLRAQQLRDDGRRPLGVNLKETISLSRKLVRFHNAMRAEHIE